MPLSIMKWVQKSSASSKTSSASRFSPPSTKYKYQPGSTSSRMGDILFCTSGDGPAVTIVMHWDPDSPSHTSASRHSLRVGRDAALGALVPVLASHLVWRFLG